MVWKIVKIKSEVKRTECWPFLLNVTKIIFRALKDKVGRAHEFVCLLLQLDRKIISLFIILHYFM